MSSIYLILCVLLFLMQDRLIFLPSHPDKNIYSQFKANEISFEADEMKRHGWRVLVNSAAQKTLLYFGGNAEDVVYLNFEAEQLDVQQIITINHPGYGKSEGEPSQKNLYQNALNTYDYVLNKYNLEPANVVIMGRSLGSAVASYLAANRKNAGLVLVTPFDSIANLAAEHYKYFPVKILLKHKFSTIDFFSKISSPILVIAARQDEVITIKSLQNVKSKLGDKNEFVLYDGVGHNTIQNHFEYYEVINKFITKL